MGQWSERWIQNLWRSNEIVQTPTFVVDVVRSSGTSLDNGDLSVMQSRFNCDFSKIRIHTDDRAAFSAERLGAAAYAAGRHLVFARGQYAPGTESGRRILAHELAHVVQGQRWLTSSGQESPPAVMARDIAAEQDADAWTTRRPLHAGPAKATCFAVRPSIAEKILKFASKQLEKRTVKTVSKHIARHTRRMPERAIHTVFRNPREIRYLLQRTFREATEIAARHPTAGTQKVIEEGSIRITRQPMQAPGKFRLFIQKVLDKEIGTKGERVLCITLDQSGRIVSAFPADRLKAIGLTAAGIETFTEGTARVGEAVQAQEERAVAVEKEREDQVDFWAWVPLIGDIWGGSLNEGEDEMLRQEREIATLVKATIDDVEKSEQRTLGEPERRELEQLIRTAIASPLVEDQDPD
ncbi:TPA: DUF4157 domain-containing protein [Pseudomonas putida]|nr:DUF4157 domain-containing protein [Pseudomonas putida]